MVNEKMTWLWVDYLWFRGTKMILCFDCRTQFFSVFSTFFLVGLFPCPSLPFLSSGLSCHSPLPLRRRTKSLRNYTATKSSITHPSILLLPEAQSPQGCWRVRRRTGVRWTSRRGGTVGCEILCRRCRGGKWRIAGGVGLSCGSRSVVGWMGGWGGSVGGRRGRHVALLTDDVWDEWLQLGECGWMWIQCPYSQRCRQLCRYLQEEIASRDLAQLPCLHSSSLHAFSGDQSSNISYYSIALIIQWWPSVNFYCFWAGLDCHESVCIRDLHFDGRLPNPGSAQHEVDILLFPVNKNYNTWNQWDYSRTPGKVRGEEWIWFM